MLFIIKQSYQKKHSYSKRRLVYLSCIPKCFHENIKVSLTNITYNMHSIHSNNQAIIKAIKTISCIRKSTKRATYKTKEVESARDVPQWHTQPTMRLHIARKRDNIQAVLINLIKTLYMIYYNLN